MFKRHLILLLSTVLVSCSKPSSYDIEVPITSEVEKLIQHTSEFDKQVLSYETSGGKIHFAIGFGIANSIMVEGDKGNIIIDASDSVFEAEKIYSLFSQKNSNPIKAIIYTHNHGDHTFGTAFYVNNQDEKPQIIAHEDTAWFFKLKVKDKSEMDSLMNKEDYDKFAKESSS